uniref:Uncharacterized protein n=1 Tax=Arundo donax TaxID=35708 RepID=A0A0A9A4M8_ARUDO
MQRYNNLPSSAIIPLNLSLYGGGHGDIYSIPSIRKITSSGARIVKKKKLGDW